MRKDRFLLGASADVPNMWSHAVLRQLTESARQQTRAREWTSSDRVGAARRALVVLLSRRGLCRVLVELPCASVADLLFLSHLLKGRDKGEG